MPGTIELPEAASSVSETSDVSAGAAEPRSAETPLWRNGPYQLLSVGGACSWIGLVMAEVVYPLLILGATGSPMLAAVFGVIQFLAMILGALPAGSLIDRYDRRRILIGSEAVRAVAAASLAIAIAAGHVWLVQIYLMAAVLGACQPFGAVRMIVIRAVVPKGRLNRALAQQQARGAAAMLIGPAVGTALFAAGRALPFVVGAAVLALSLITAILVRYDRSAEPERPGEAQEAAEPDDGRQADLPADPGSGGGVLAGLRTLWSRPLMRSAMLIIMVLNLIGVPIDLVLIVQARHEGVPTHYIGLIIAAFAAGSILGAPLIPVLHRRIRPGWLLIGFVALVTAVLPLLAVPLGGFWMAGCIATLGLAMPALEVLLQVLIFQQVPDGQRGRVMSAAMMLMSLGMPVGSALGGLLLQLLDPTGAILLFAAISGVSTLLAVSQRSLRSADWPEAPAAG